MNSTSSTLRPRLLNYQLKVVLGLLYIAYTPENYSTPDNTLDVFQSLEKSVKGLGACGSKISAAVQEIMHVCDIYMS